MWVEPLVWCVWRGWALKRRFAFGLSGEAKKVPRGQTRSTALYAGAQCPPRPPIGSPRSDADRRSAMIDRRMMSLNRHVPLRHAYHCVEVISWVILTKPHRFTSCFWHKRHTRTGHTRVTVQIARRL